MSASRTQKLYAALGAALLLVSSNVCLLTVCIPAEVRAMTRAAAHSDCCANPAAKAHPDRTDSIPCGGPCDTGGTLASTPQLSSPASLGPLALPAVVIAPLVLDEPLDTPARAGRTGPEPLPPQPPPLDAAGVRAPPIA